MGPPFWCWILIILRVLLGVSCTQSSCHGNFLPGGFYFATGRNMVENHWLSGYVFETLTVSLPVQCFRKCRSNCRCISFNYLTTVNQPDNCELNEENKYLKPDALQPKEGSQYYDLVIDYNVGVSLIDLTTHCAQKIFSCVQISFSMYSSKLEVIYQTRELIYETPSRVFDIYMLLN